MPNLFMIDLEGIVLSEFEKTLLHHPNIGSVILFTRNFNNPEQLKALVDSIHSIRPDIFIAVDHEGGFVQRFQRFGFRSLPSARVYGDVYDLNPETGLKLACNYGEIMAHDLLMHGIDLSLAPVVDLQGESDVIAKLDRAFHHDPDVVEALAGAFIDGMNNAGMPSVCKHFPGHGSCRADSHIIQSVYEGSEEKLRDTDLRPFNGLIKKQKIAAIMPAHVIYKAIDAENPAGFSKRWLQDILRLEFGFQGLVISDCLSMKGADIGDMKTRAEQALKAGCELLIICNQPRELLYEVLDGINFVPNKESEKRLEVFKQHMMRFQNIEVNKKLTNSSVSLTLMGSSIHSAQKKNDCKDVENVISGNINRTMTI